MCWLGSPHRPNPACLEPLALNVPLRGEWRNITASRRLPTNELATPIISLPEPSCRTQNWLLPFKRATCRRRVTVRRSSRAILDSTLLVPLSDPILKAGGVGAAREGGRRGAGGRARSRRLHGPGCVQFLQAGNRTGRRCRPSSFAASPFKQSAVAFSSIRRARWGMRWREGDSIARGGPAYRWASIALNPSRRHRSRSACRQNGRQDSVLAAMRPPSLPEIKQGTWFWMAVAGVQPHLGLAVSPAKPECDRVGRAIEPIWQKRSRRARTVVGLDQEPFSLAPSIATAVSPSRPCVILARGLPTWPRP